MLQAVLQALNYGALQTPILGSAMIGAQGMMGLSAMGLAPSQVAASVMGNAMLERMGIADQLNPEEVAQNPEYMFDTSSILGIGEAVKHKIINSPHTAFKYLLAGNLMFRTLPAITKAITGQAPLTRNAIPFGLRTLMLGSKSTAFRGVVGGFMGSMFGTTPIGKIMGIATGAGIGQTKYLEGGLLGLIDKNTNYGISKLFGAATGTPTVSLMQRQRVRQTRTFKKIEPVQWATEAEEQWAEQFSPMRNIGQTARTGKATVAKVKDLRLWDHAQTTKELAKDFAEKRNKVREWVGVTKSNLSQIDVSTWHGRLRQLGRDMIGRTARHTSDPGTLFKEKLTDNLASRRTAASLWEEAGQTKLGKKGGIARQYEFSRFMTAAQVELSQQMRGLFTWQASGNPFVAAFQAPISIARWMTNAANPERIIQASYMARRVNKMTRSGNRLAERDVIQRGDVVRGISDKLTATNAKRVLTKETEFIGDNFLKSNFRLGVGREMLMAGAQHLPGLINFAIMMNMLKKGTTAVATQALSTVKTVSAMATNIGKMEFGSGRSLETAMASTERSRAITAMQNVGITARSYLGNEAALMAQ